MDLSLKKYINNTLPRYELGTELDNIDVFGRRMAVKLPQQSFGIPSSISNIQLKQPGLDSATAASSINPLKGVDAKSVNTPKVKTGTSSGQLANGIANAGMGLIQGIGVAQQVSDASKAQLDPNELVQKYGTREQYGADGLQYTAYNDIDAEKEMNQVKKQTNQSALGAAAAGASAGAAIGSIVPGWGTAIGAVAGGLIGGVAGIFGGNKRKREERRRIEQAKQMAANKTMHNRSLAVDDMLQKRALQRSGDVSQQVLYSAALGKDEGVDPITRQTTKDHVVNTALGKKIGPQNAWVSKDEWIEDKEGNISKVPEGKHDTARAYLNSTDTVYSNKIKNPITGNTIAHDVPAYAEQGALEDLKYIQHEERNNMQYSKKGDIRRYENGAEWLTNFAPHLSNALTAWGQYREAADSDIYRPKTYRENQQARMALQDLDKLRVDPYNAIMQQRQAEARQSAAIAKSGGLSAAQQMLARVASLNTTQQNIYNANAQVQKENNALRAAAAQAKLAAGEQAAQRQQQADQWDIDYMSKAHAARQQGKQTALYNFNNALQSYVSNEFTRKQFNRQMKLYGQELDLKKTELDALIKKWNGGNTSSQASLKKSTNTTPYNYSTNFAYTPTKFGSQSWLNSSTAAENMLPISQLTDPLSGMKYRTWMPTPKFSFNRSYFK